MGIRAFIPKFHTVHHLEKKRLLQNEWIAS